MAPQKYLDLDVTIEQRQADFYPVVIRSPAGEARVQLRLPAEGLELKNQLLNLENALLHGATRHRVVLTPEEQTVQAFGAALFDALVVDDARSRYDVSRDEARRENAALRVRLRILAPEVAILPWEFLYDKREREYLCLSDATPLVRYQELPQPLKPLTVTGPIRILAMIASPRDLPALQVNRERARLEQALEPLRKKGMVDLTFLQQATARELQRTLSANSWHVFHYIGHGGFDHNKDEGYLAFEDDNRDTHRLGAVHLARLLSCHSHLRLAVLNACLGARGSARDSFSSTAGILAQRGLPAVLAMQYSISDEAAIYLTEGLYEGIAEGKPIDAAVTAARQLLSYEFPASLEWGTPVLLMRSQDAVLFKTDTSSHTAIKQEQSPTNQPINEAPTNATADPATLTLPNETTHQDTYSTSMGYVTKGLQRLRKWISSPDKLTASKYSTTSEIHSRASTRTPKPIINSKLAECLARGNDHLAKKNYEEALAAYAEAINIDPENASVYYFRAAVFYQQRKMDRALSDLNTAIRNDPNYAEAYCSRGIIYYEQRRWSTAMDDFSTAIDIDKNYAKSYYRRGRLRYDLSSFDEALIDLNRAVKLAPNYAGAYCVRGMVYFNKKELNRALDDLKRATSLAPSSYEAYGSRGKIYYALKEVNLAIDDFTKAINLYPGYYEAYYNRAELYIELREINLALEDLNKAIEIKPDYSRAYLERATLYRSLGNLNSAFADFRKAVDCEPDLMQRTIMEMTWPNI